MICSLSLTSNSESISTRTSSSRRRNRGVRATENGIVKLRNAKRNLNRDHESLIENDNKIAGVTNLELGCIANVSESTVKRFFEGKFVDKDCASSIVGALNLEYSEIIEEN